MVNNFIQQFITISKQAFAVNNGNIPKWEAVLDAIKKHPQGVLDYQAPYLTINSIDDDTETLQQTLKALIPWRKGPYQIANLQLDSEWHGDMKWDRVLPHIQPLKDKSVLDVGSGNGYFTYLMALEGAEIALGIEPFLLFNYQFNAIRTLINNPPNAFVLPLKLEQLKVCQHQSVLSLSVKNNHCR